MEEKSKFSRETFINFEQLKSFFEDCWDADSFRYKIVDPDGQLTDRESMAYIKMALFLGGYYIDAYDEKIEKA